jgi:hypothetical protein
MEQVDTQKLVQAYVRYYPLFQKAYQELGYPNGYFNDRLVEVIDHLLAAPDVPAPIALAQPKVLYEFADPALESRSAGQKILMRMGPVNEARVKAKKATINGVDISNLNRSREWARAIVDARADRPVALIKQAIAEKKSR